MVNLRPEQMDVSTGTTDNDTVTTKGYVDDSVATVDTWDEVMHLGNTFTIADNENLSATITQNDTTNNPAALIINNTGSGNDITLPNSSYIKNGVLVLGGDIGLSGTPITKGYFSAGSFFDGVNQGITLIDAAYAMQVVNGGYSVQMGRVSTPAALVATDGTQIVVMCDNTNALDITGNVIFTSGDLGLTGTRVTKGWFTDIESTNYPSVGGTALSNQYLATTNSPTFVGATLSGLTTANGIVQTNGSGVLSSSVTLPDGTLATTQSPLDNSTKLATTAYVDTAITTVDSWDEVMHNGSTFTVLDTENLSATITQNDTTNNPAALIIANTGSGNDITLPNSSYIKNGGLVLGGDIGLTGTRITKGWFTDLEITNYPSVNGTALTDQYLATTDTPTFAQVTVDNLVLNGNTLAASSGDLNLTSTVGTDITLTAGTTNEQLIIASNDGMTSIQKWDNDKPFDRFYRRIRGSSIVQSGDGIVEFSAQGWDGATYQDAASIKMLVDGTPGLGDMPGAIEFYTVADGATVLTKRLKIDNAGLSEFFGTIKIDNLSLTTNTLSSTSGNLLLTPVAGSSAVIDSHWGFDDKNLTALTDADSVITAFAGKNITIEGVTFDGGVVAGISSLTATALIATAGVDVGTTLTVAGGHIMNITTVNAATYDLLVSDYILNVTYTITGAVTSLTLPTAQTTNGRVIHIKDAGGNAATNSITIDTQGGEEIDGQATLVINSDYNSVSLYSDGSDWFIF